MTRYWRLWPPPMWRVVMRPWLLRPPVLDSGRRSDFSGVDRVISAKSATDEPRRPGVVGLYLRIAMFSSPLSRPSADCREDVDGARLQGHDGALGVLALAGAEAGAAGLADAVDRVDRSDLDAEDLLDGELDLSLRGAGDDQEGVLALVDEPVALLRNDRLQDDVARVLVQTDHAEILSVCANPGHAETSSVAPALDATKASTTCRRSPRARSLSAPSRAAAIIFLGVRCA